MDWVGSQGWGRHRVLCRGVTILLSEVQGQRRPVLEEKRRGWGTAFLKTSQGTMWPSWVLGSSVVTLAKAPTPQESGPATRRRGKWGSETASGPRRCGPSDDSWPTCGPPAGTGPRERAEVWGARALFR